jgi:hypothetical protein
VQHMNPAEGGHLPAVSWMSLPSLSMAVRISGPLVSSRVATWWARFSAITCVCVCVGGGDTHTKTQHTQHHMKLCIVAVLKTMYPEALRF